MAVTENPEWAERMRLMSLHGMSRDAWKRYTAEGAWYYEIIAPGYKYNLTDLAATIGVQQLKKCDYFWQRRCHYAALYTEGLRDLPEITVPRGGDRRSARMASLCHSVTPRTVVHYPR